MFEKVKAQPQLNLNPFYAKVHEKYEHQLEEATQAGFVDVSIKKLRLARTGTINKIFGVLNQIEEGEKYTYEISPQASPTKDDGKETIQFYRKDSQGIDQYFGTFTLDCNFKENQSFSFDDDKNFSNSVINSFVFGLVLYNGKWWGQKLWDIEVEFAVQEENLRKSLQEKQQKNVAEEKNWLVAMSTELNQLVSFRRGYPEKMEIFTQVLTVLNKVVNGQASPDDISNLAKYSNEVIEKGSPAFVILGVGLEITGWAFIIGSLAFVINPTLGALIVIGIPCLIAGVLLHLQGRDKKLLNENLSKVIKEETARNPSRQEENTTRPGVTLGSTQNQTQDSEVFAPGQQPKSNQDTNIQQTPTSQPLKHD